MKRTFLGLLALAAFSLASCNSSCDVLIVGGGASGTMAGLQASRMGCKTIIAEETVWIGGMLTSAGVSAVDGNYRLRGGLFGEFTDALAAHYGGYEALKTAWVSHIMFEPSVGEAILESKVAKEKHLTLYKEYRFESAEKLAKGGWKVHFSTPDGKKTIKCRILIDGTELGDVAKACGVKYHIGFDPKSYTHEATALETGNDLVQDMTMVMTLKDYGPGADMTIACPEGYDINKYVNCCINPLNNPETDKGQQKWSPEMMLTYGKLQNGKYMINWPVEANDFYANIIDLSREQRDSVIHQAKLRTLGFLYFLQTELGYKNLGLANDEYPTPDKLAFFPYHRESRRIEGEYLFTLDELSDRYSRTAYRTGVAVGDYPVDHHHYACPQWEEFAHLWFGKVPSYTLPAGTLVPLGVEDLVVAEKSICVSNLVNGTTRLQPVVCEIGQAAGVFAALAIKNKCEVREVKVRDVQKVLLDAGAYIQPYLDLPLSDPDFKALQRVGSTGILHAEGRNVAWSNESWMRVSEPLRWNDLYLEDYYGISHNPSAEGVSVSEFVQLLHKISSKDESQIRASLGDVRGETLTRLQAVRAIDKILAPFDEPVDFKGQLIK